MRKPGPVTGAACWAHGRRKFFELAAPARAHLAVEAVRRIDAIFDIERGSAESWSRDVTADNP